MAKRLKTISICIEDWLDDLLIIRAKEHRVSKSKTIRDLIKLSIIHIPDRRSNIGYYNDSKGILRSKKL